MKYKFKYQEDLDLNIVIGLGKGLNETCTIHQVQLSTRCKEHTRHIHLSQPMKSAWQNSYLKLDTTNSSTTTLDKALAGKACIMKGVRAPETFTGMRVSVSVMLPSE